MTSVLARALVVLEGDATRLKQTFTEAEGRMLKLGRRMREIGGQLTTRVTLPAVAMGAGVVKAFADFDGAMTQSLAIMGNVSGELQAQMRETAKEVARTTTFSAKEAADAYFFLASAGLNAEQQLAAMPAVARFAQAGMFNLATATDLATDAQSALGLTVKDPAQNLENLTHVTDVLVKANTLANASVDQFSRALTTEAGAALKSFHIDMEEGVAVLAAFADQGVKGETAGSGLSRILRLVTAAAVNNKTAMKKLGIEVFDSNGKIRNLGDIIKNLEDALGGMSDQQRTAALAAIGFKARVQGIILPLLGTSDAIKRYEAQLRQAKGTTEEVAEKQLQSFAAQLKLLWNNIVLAAIAIGESLEPQLRKLVATLTSLAQKFAALPDWVKQTVVALVGLAAVLGPLLILAGALTAAFTVIGGTAAAVIAAILALGVAGLQAVQHWTALKISFLQIWSDIKRTFFEAIDSILRWVSDFIRPLKPALLAVGGAVGAAVAGVGDLAEAFRGDLKKSAESSLTWTQGFIERLEAELLAQQGNVGGLKNAWQQFKAALTGDAGIDLSALAGAGDDLLDLSDAADPVKDALEEFQKSMQQTKNMAALMGNEFDANAAEISALEAVITSLTRENVAFGDVLDDQGNTLEILRDRLLKLRAEADATAKRTAEWEEGWKLVTAAIKGSVTPMEEYKKTLAALTAAFLMNLISLQDFVKGLENAKQKLTEANEGVKDIDEQLQESAAHFRDEFIDAIVEFALTGKQEFSEFVRHALLELAKLAIKLNLLKAIESGGFLSFLQIGGHQHGGFIQPNSLGVVGEAGPELIQAGRTGLRVIPLDGEHLTAAGGGEVERIITPVTVNVNAVDQQDVVRFFENNESLVASAILKAQQKSSVLRRRMR